MAIVKGLIRKTLAGFIERTKPLVWRVAGAYDVRINTHVRPQGQHPVILKGGLEDARRNIHKTVYFNTRSGSISIGENTILNADVMVLTGTHYNIAEAEAERMPLHFVPENGRDVAIGRGCFIGSGAIIIGKVSIGDYSVVGAGSVVTKDVPARTFVAGIPAKPVRTL